MSTEPLLHVSGIQVEGLFDRFDHQVDLKPDEWVTILHGPNGVGKTMLLRMVSDLLIGRYSLFLQIPFQRFASTLTDGFGSDGGSKLELTINPYPDQAGAGPSKTLQLGLLEGGKQKETHDISSGENPVEPTEDAGAVTSADNWRGRRTRREKWQPDGHRAGCRTLYRRLGARMAEGVTWQSHHSSDRSALIVAPERGSSK